MADTSSLLWRDPAWIQKAHAWIHAETKRRSIQVTGEIEQPHVLAWSTVMRVPSSEGILFFKATAEESMFEIALTKRLADWFPDRLPELVAVDIVRGWMLMRDGGEQLRASIRPTQDIRPWEPVIRSYAELQVGLAKHVEELLALGIPDYRLAALPALYGGLLADEAMLLIDQEKGLTRAELEKLHTLEPRFRQVCEQLAGFGIPESLNHGDFHDGNVLLKNGRIAFFDWGEASITHPFVSLRTFFVSIENSLKLEDYSFTPEMAALLDVYLEPWQKFASKQVLLSAHAFSEPVASLVTALAWHETISRMDSTLRKEYEWIVPDVLREFIMHEKLLPH